MDNSLLSCILNPVRMRIIQTLIKNKEMTVQQIGKELTDIPQATLYRHLNKLVKARAIVVLKESKVRGALERTYGIKTNPYSTVVSNGDGDNKTEYLNLFYNFLMILMGDFQRYIDSDNINLEKDGVMFRSAAIYMSDKEYGEFLVDLIKAFDKVRDNGPSPERRLRKISTITMPGLDGEE